MSASSAPSSPTSGTPEWLRTVNDRLALRLLIEHQALSRAQIRELANVSKPTASQMVLRLEQAGLIEPVGKTSGPRGRNAIVYALRPDSICGVAMTVDALRIQAVVVDAAGGDHPVVTFPNLPERDPAGDVQAAIEAAYLAAGVEKCPCTHVTIGIQGAVHHTEDILDFAGTLPGWPTVGVHEQIRTHRGVEVTIDNDANLAAIAEREAGTAGADQDFIFLWLGKGIGAGLDIDGKPRTGATGNAGEIGYLELPLSAAQIDPDAKDFTDLLGDEALFKMFGTQDFDVALGMLADSPAHMRDYAQRVALLIRPLASVLDPALIILGGPVGTVGGQGLSRLVQEAAGPEPIVLPTQTGMDSVLIGARSLLLNQLHEELERRIELDQWEGNQSARP